jgi:hypothetical protein
MKHSGHSVIHAVYSKHQTKRMKDIRLTRLIDFLRVGFHSYFNGSFQSAQSFSLSPRLK